MLGSTIIEYIFLLFIDNFKVGFPGGSEVRNPPANARDTGLIPRLGRSPGEPTPVFLPGESHGQRSLASYSPRGHRRVRHD